MSSEQTPDSQSQQVEELTMQSLLVSTFHKLLDLLSTRKHKDLKQACTDALAKLEDNSTASDDDDADRYFLPLKLACESESAKMIALSVDCMNQLIGNGYLTGSLEVEEKDYPYKNKREEPKKGGNRAQAAAEAAEAVSSSDSQVDLAENKSSTSPSSSGKRRLMEVIIETLFDSSNVRDSQVQLQVVRAFLTAVSSVNCQVHGSSLLQAVSGCYQVYLQSSDDNIKNTSKATLTQIFNIVFQRMENYSAQLKQLESSAPQASKQPSKPISPFLNTPYRVRTSQPQNENEEEESSDDSTKETEASDSEPQSPSSTPTPQPSNDSADTPRPPPGKRGYCVTCSKPANYYCLQTQDPVCGMECKMANLQKKGEQHRIQMVAQIKRKFRILFFDTLALFRAMVRLSGKSLPQPVEQTSVDSKTLSLQLLLSLFHNAGLQFRTAPEFLKIIREELVSSLMKNAVSPIDLVFGLSSSVFVSLVTHFKYHLKAEIGVFLEHIYLRLLSSPHSTYFFKYMSLKVISAIAQDHQALIDVFLNYDCDSHLPPSCNIFASIVSTLEKIAQGRFVSVAENWMTSAEDTRLRLDALEALSSALRSLAIWTKKAQILSSSSASSSLLSPSTPASVSSSSSSSSAAAPVAPSPVTPSELEDDSPLDKEPQSIRSKISSLPGIPTLPRDSDADQTSSSSSSVDQQQAAIAAANLILEHFAATRSLKQRLDKGVTAFNEKPKRGLEYLFSVGLLKYDETESTETTKEATENTTSPNNFKNTKASPKEKAIAAFFHEQEGLDKTVIGDYMGDDKAENLHVMYAYIDMINFAGDTFDDAMRKLIAGFRLPGESQKIDRILEKFGSKYHDENPGTFSSGDTAHVLAFSTMMLNTDAHNNQVKRKMTKEEFLRNNRGIDNGKDIDAEYLSNLYDRIVNHEIKMKDEEAQMGGLTPNEETQEISRTKRFQLFLAELQRLLSRAQSVLESRQAKYLQRADSRMRKERAENKQSDESLASFLAEGGWYSATSSDVEAVRWMFEIIWYPALATFSVLLEQSDVEKTVELCLDGYRSSIRISAYFSVDTSRVAFISSLRKFTLLGSGKELKKKNLDAIKSLLSISYTEGDFLRESWAEVLGCISEVERLQLIASSKNPSSSDVLLSSVPPSPSSSSSSSFFSSSSANSKKEKEIFNGQQVAQQIDASLVDRVFTSTTHLSVDALIDFVAALRLVSEQELGITGASAAASASTSPAVSQASSSHSESSFSATASMAIAASQLSQNLSAPRIFSLQKLTEVCYYNASRLKLIWPRLWVLLADYYVMAGCHANLQVCLYCVDSLRQLAFQILEKDELANSSLQLQKQVLKPFEFIMMHCPNNDVKELIVQCLSRFIMAKVSNIKSGWKAIAVVLSLSAKEKTTPALVTSAFDLCHSLFSRHFSLLTEQQPESVEELVNALVSFGCNQFTDISLQSIDFLLVCANYLGSVTKPTTESENEEQQSQQQDPSHWMRVWFLLLTGFSRMVADNRLEVRSRALTVLFKILHVHGLLFSKSTWRAIFHGVLFPIFDDVRHGRLQENQGFINPSQPIPPPPTTPPPQSFMTPTRTKSTRELSTNKDILQQPTTSPTIYDSNSWLHTTCFSALSTLVELFARFYDRVAFLLPDILLLICSCIHQPLSSNLISILQSPTPSSPNQSSSFSYRSNELEVSEAPSYSSFGEHPHDLDLSKIGIKCFHILMQSSGAQLSVGEWDMLLQAWSEMVKNTLPEPLLSMRTRAALGLMPPLPPLPTSSNNQSGSASESSDTNSQQYFQASVQSTPLLNSLSSLPFNVAAIHAKCRIQLLLLDVIFHAVTTFFPPRKFRHFSSGQTEVTTDRTSKRRPRISVVSVLAEEKTRDSPLTSSSSSSSSSTLPSSGTMQFSHLFAILDTLNVSLEFARTFNADISLRRKLYHFGFVMENATRLPQLFFQEAHATNLSIQFLFRLVTEDQYDMPDADASQQAKLQPPRSRTNSTTANASTTVVSSWSWDSEEAEDADLISENKAVSEAEARLFTHSNRLLSEYVQKTQAGQLVALECLEDVIQTFLSLYYLVPKHQFARYCTQFYPSLVDLIEFGSQSIRSNLRRLFADRIQSLLFAATLSSSPEKAALSSPASTTALTTPKETTDSEINTSETSSSASS